MNLRKKLIDSKLYQNWTISSKVLLNYFRDFERISHHRPLVTNDVRYKSFPVKFCCKFSIILMGMFDYRTFSANRIISRLFPAEFCWTTSVVWRICFYHRALLDSRVSNGPLWPKLCSIIWKLLEMCPSQVLLANDTRNDCF